MNKPLVRKTFDKDPSLFLEGYNFHDQLENLSDEDQLTIIKQDIRNLKKIKTSAKVQMQLFTKNKSKQYQPHILPMSLDFVTASYIAMIPNPDPEFQMFCITTFPDSFKKLKQQTEAVQLIAINFNSDYFPYCKDPNLKVQETAIAKNGQNIRYVKVPSEKLQLIAVNNNPKSIINIKYPTPKVVDLAVMNYPLCILNIKNPTEDQLIASVQNFFESEEIFKQLKNPSLKVQEAACRYNPHNLQYLKDQGVDLCLEVLENSKLLDKIYKYIKIVPNPDHRSTIENLKKRKFIMESLK